MAPFTAPQVVEDTLEDARFSHNPLVTSPSIALRFYAGAPLLASDGAGAYGCGGGRWGRLALGTACSCAEQGCHPAPLVPCLLVV